MTADAAPASGDEGVDAGWPWPWPEARAVRHLRHADTVAREAMAHGRHPFGALLVAPDGETVLATQGNIDTVNHAESTLALPCREVFARGQRSVQVAGPVDAVREALVRTHAGFWSR